MQRVEIALRAYLPPEPKTFKEDDVPRIDLGRILVFDTETTIDCFQTLKFGSFRVYEYGRLVREGIFFKPSAVSRHEKAVLSEYCRRRGLKLITDREFVDHVFLPEVYDLGTLCAGLNLPFDLSRIAIAAGYARRHQKGGYSLRLTENNRYPRLTIKHIDSTKSIIRFTNPVDQYKHRRRFSGNFLDLHTFVYALTGDSLSLESACNLLGAAELKETAKEHGKVTTDYIDYNRQDVAATYALFLKAKEEFDLYGLEIPVTRAYSPASIGKEYLRMMGVKPFLEKNNGRISNEVLGYVTSTYIGGRSECKARKLAMLITLLDFLSMYPSMCILLGLWDFIVCDHIEQQECTSETREFVDSVTLDDLRRKETWARLNAIALVEPDADILPVRARFDGKEAYNVGDCYVKSDSGALWYALADVVNSKIRTGKAPKIIHAMRFVPVGLQRGLRPISLFGRKVDPHKDNLFKAIIEHRNAIQRLQKACKDESEKVLLDKKQKALKLVANATSYGIFMEINPKDKEAEVTAYGLERIQCRVSKLEKFGKQYNPFVSTFITSAARLVLGAVEAILAKHGAAHAFCDTDSMAVPPQYAKEIQAFFSGLNPYDFDAPLFKVEYENVMFYGISTKRYVLYRMDATGQIEVLKASSHGLGHLLNPFNKDNDDWHKKVWLDILKLHYGTITVEELSEKYSRSFALSKLAISSPQIMKRFEHLNNGEPYDRRIMPFNFCIVGVGNDIDPATGRPVKPLAPYRKNAQQCPYDKFIDYESGKEMSGLQYWKRFDDVLWQYINHPEAKFDGDVGVLRRKDVIINSVTHIGKESNNLELTEILGVQEGDYVVYGSDIQLLAANKDKILLAEPKDVRRFGVPQRTLYSIQSALKKGSLVTLKDKTVARLLAYLYSTP